MATQSLQHRSKWVIKGYIDNGEQLYWSNDDGWVDRALATTFSDSERYAFRLPLTLSEVQAEWVPA